MTKTTIHWQQRAPAWTHAYLNRTGAQYVKAMNAYDDIPGTRMIGRVYKPEAETNAMIERGAAGADEFFEWIRGFTQDHLHIWAWEGPNEPSIWHWPVLQGFNAFYVRLAELYRNHDLRLVAGNINVGWPNEDQIPYLADGLCAADYIGLHEYAWPNLWDNLDSSGDGTGWWTLRYRKTRKWLVDAGHVPPPFLITELGLDSAVAIPGPHLGWRTAMDDNPQRLAEQLWWYEQEIRKDDYVEAATVFVSEPNQDWIDFDWYEAAAMAFAALAEEEPPPPEPEPDLIIYDAAGNERDWTWLTAKYGPLVIHPAAPGPGWRVHVLRERVETFASIQVYAPQGTPVAWYWSDAPQAPDAGPLNGLPEGMNANRAFKGTTSAEGKVSFDMGQGAYYHPENGERGPHAVWIYGANTNSDVVFGLGMVSGTNNDHLDVSYWWKEEEPPPTEYYTLDIDIIPAEGGTVQGNTSPYEAGTTAHLEAVPADGWQFDGWTGDAQSSNSTLDLMMDADKHLAANFVEGDEPPEPDIEAAKAHIQKADELAALLREQLDLAMKALGVT